METLSLRGLWRPLYVLAASLWFLPLAAFAQDAGDDAPQPPPEQSDEATPPQNDAPAPPATRRPLTAAEKALFNAIELGDVDAARAALQRGAGVDALTGNDATPLMKAAFYGEKEMVGLLLQAGANPRRQNAENQTTILIASMEGFLFPDTAGKIHEAQERTQRDATSSEWRQALREAYEAAFKERNEKSKEVNATKTEVVQMLLDAGASPRTAMYNGVTPLFKAVAAENPPLVRLLLQRGASPYARTENGETPLLRALRNSYSGDMPGRNEVVRELLAVSGPDGKAAAINTTGGWNGWTPLLTAAAFGNLEAARLLIERGADPNRPNGKSLGAESFGETTPLMAAGAGTSRNPEMVRLLLDAGAKADARTSQGNALNALFRNAEYFGEPDEISNPETEKMQSIAASLVEAGANVNARDKEGRTPLFGAVRYGDAKLAAFLISKGADVRARTKSGANALSYAVYRAPAETLRMLLAAGVSPDVYDNEGLTPLMRATLRKDAADIVALLLDAGADVNAVSRNEAKMTALHWASRTLQGGAAIEPLVKAGANLYAEDSQGMTPLFTAIQYQFDGYVNHLLRLGADPRRPNSQGVSALEYARQQIPERQRAGADVSQTEKILRLLEGSRQ